MTRKIEPGSCFMELKVRQRELRDGFPTNLALRVHRAISWLGRAEREDDDLDARFIFYWIAFNAAYAEDTQSTNEWGERACFEVYFEKIVRLDGDNRLYGLIWNRFAGPIRLLLNNRYVFAPFWSSRHGEKSIRDWEAAFAGSRRRVDRALAETDTVVILSILFDRLYVLRNQLIHGGATWNSSVNRDQVRDGAEIMSLLVPVFIDLMMGHSTVEWDEPYYPVVE